MEEVKNKQEDLIYGTSQRQELISWWKSSLQIKVATATNLFNPFNTQWIISPAL